MQGLEFLGGLCVAFGMGARVVFVFFQTVPCLRLDDMGLSTLYVCGSARRLPDFFCAGWQCVLDMCLLGRWGMKVEGR